MADNHYETSKSLSSSLLEKGCITEKLSVRLSNRKHKDSSNKCSTPKQRSNSLILNPKNTSSLYNTKIKFLILANIFFFSLGCLITKMFSSFTELSSITLCFYIGFYMICFSLLFLKFDNIGLSKEPGKDKYNFNIQKLDAYILRSGLGCISIISTTIGLYYVKLSIFTVIVIINPILANLILKKIQKDKIKKFEVICILVILSFLILTWFIDEDYDEGVNLTLGIFVTLFSVLINSIIYIIDMNLCNDFHPYYINTFTGVLLVTFCPILLSIKNESFNVLLSMHLLIIVLGACYFFGVYFSMKATYYGDVLLYSPYNNLGILLILINAKFVFDEDISIADMLLVMAILIISYVRYLFFKKM